MKLYVILGLLSLSKQLCCADLSANSSKASYDEIESQNFQLLKIEIANLKEELYKMREKNHNLTMELNAKHMNYIALAKEAEYISQNFKTLSEDLRHFNSFVDNQLAVHPTKNDVAKNTEDNETVCLPMKFFGFKFVDKSLFEKVCDVKQSNGEWTVIQRRIDGKTNFTRPWADYKNGFGNTSAEFFVGLDGLHLLTTCATQELLIEMEDYEHKKRYAKYDLFKIGDESEAYAMKELGKYEGDAGDSLRRHKSQKFSTFDHDNDKWDDNCALNCKGGWWFENCLNSNLNGEYGNNRHAQGVNWYDYHGLSYSLKKVEMKIRIKSLKF